MTLTQAASRITTNAAAVATAMAGGTSTAEAQALAILIGILAARNDLSYPALELLPPTNGAQIAPN